MDKIIETKKRDNIVKIFSDGSISSVGSDMAIGSYAATVLLPGKEAPDIVFGSCSHTSISRMEILAINEGLNYVIGLIHTIGLLPGILEIEIFTDSQYFRDCATGEKDRLKNMDLWRAFDVLGKRFASITVNKIPRNSEPLQAESDRVAGICRVAIQETMRQTMQKIKEPLCPQPKA